MKHLFFSLFIFVFVPQASLGQSGRAPESYKEFSAKLKPDAKKKFDKLLVARDAFEKAESNFYAEAVGRAYFEANQFPARLTELEKVSAPKFNKNDFESSDRSLNESYKKIPGAWSNGNDKIMSEVSRKLKLVENSWIEYRDAWVEFGLSFAPKSTAEAWKTWITRERIAQFNEFDLKGP